MTGNPGDVPVDALLAAGGVCRPIKQRHVRPVDRPKFPRRLVGRIGWREPHPKQRDLDADILAVGSAQMGRDAPRLGPAVGVCAMVRGELQPPRSDWRPAIFVGEPASMS